MTAILAKENMKKGRSKSFSVVITQGGGDQERKNPYIAHSYEKKPVKKQNIGSKGHGKNVTSTSNALKNEGYKGKCNY